MKKNIAKKILCILAIFAMAFTTVSFTNTTNASAAQEDVWQQSKWDAFTYYSTAYYNVTFKTNINKDLITNAYVEIADNNENVFEYIYFGASYLENEQCYKSIVGRWTYAYKYRCVIEYVTPTGKQHKSYSRFYNF